LIFAAPQADLNFCIFGDDIRGCVRVLTAMRKLIGVAVIILAAAFLIWDRHLLPRRAGAAATATTSAWNLTGSRSPDNIGWPDNDRDDSWTGFRPQLTVTHPSGRQMSFANVEFTAQRERGQLTTIRLSLRDLTHAEMMARSRAFCDAWNWPATYARLRQVYPDGASAKTPPVTWLAQTRGVSLRVSHEGADPNWPWCVDFDWNLRGR
jgi:hypothetical protein